VPEPDGVPMKAMWKLPELKPPDAEQVYFKPPVKTLVRDA